MRVLVVDRSRAFGEALVHLLQQAGIAAAYTGFAAVTTVGHGPQPSLALVDADAGTDRVTEAVRTLTSAADVRVLLLAAEHGTEPEALVRRTGAVGWITRHSSAEGLLAAIRRGHHARGPGAVRPAAAATNGHPDGDLARLTPREIEVLRHLTAGHRNVDIARALRISPHTARTHVQNILAKTGTRTRLEAASIARKSGLQPPAGTAGATA